MGRVIVTFCNAVARDVAVGLVDIGTRAFGWISVGQVPQPVVGATGICRVGERIVIAVQHPDRRSGLVALDRHWRVVDYVLLQDASDVHSLVAKDDRMVVYADTGGDGVGQIAYLPGQGFHDPHPVWCRGEGRSDADTVHLNALTRCGETVLVSMFGEKVSGSWRDAASGVIWDTQRQVPIAEGVAHPHSLRQHEGRLYWTESRHGRIWAADPDGQNPTQWSIGGYVRGLEWCDGLLLAGISAERRVSRSGGTQNQLPAGDAAGDSWILGLSAGVTSWRMPMTLYGSEIYDLHAAPIDWTGAPDGFGQPGAATRRVRRLEESVWEQQAWAVRLQGEIQRERGSLGQQTTKWNDGVMRSLLDALAHCTKESAARLQSATAISWPKWVATAPTLGECRTLSWGVEQTWFDGRGWSGKVMCVSEGGAFTCSDDRLSEVVLYIQSGVGRVRVGAEWTSLAAGDVVRVASRSSYDVEAYAEMVILRAEFNGM